MRSCCAGRAVQAQFHGCGIGDDGHPHRENRVGVVLGLVRSRPAWVSAGDCARPCRKHKPARPTPPVDDASKASAIFRPANAARMLDRCTRTCLTREQPRSAGRSIRVTTRSLRLALHGHVGRFGAAHLCSVRPSYGAEPRSQRLVTPARGRGVCMPSCTVPISGAVVSDARTHR